MSLSQVSCAVFARGLRACSMRLWRATRAQDHPETSSCFQRGAAAGGRQPTIKGTHKLPPLASASTSGLAPPVAGLRGKTPAWCRERMSPRGEGEPGEGRSPSVWAKVLHRFTQAGWLCDRAESQSPAGVSAEKVRGMGGFMVRYLICIAAAPLPLHLSYFGPPHLRILAVHVLAVSWSLTLCCTPLHSLSKLQTCLIGKATRSSRSFCWRRSSTTDLTTW